MYMRVVALAVLWAALVAVTVAPARPAGAPGPGGRAVPVLAAADAPSPAQPEGPSRQPAGGTEPPERRAGRTPARVAPAVSVPVLAYHHIVPARELEARPGWHRNPAVISAEQFEAQVEALVRAGYRTIDTFELAAHLWEGAPLPERPILLTFDDGYESFATHALPRLRKHGMKATLFVVTSWAGGRTPARNSLRYLDWASITELARTGLVDVQSHTAALHGDGSEAPPLLSAGWDELVRDFTRAADEIAARTGRRPVALAYPQGAYTAQAQAAAARAGYRLAFGPTTREPLHRPADLYALPRIFVHPRARLRLPGL